MAVAGVRSAWRGRVPAWGGCGRGWRVGLLRLGCETSKSD